MFTYSLKALSLVICSVVLTLGVLAPTPAAAQDCKAVSAWMKENAGRLPSSYEGLIRQPASYRRAIFSSLTPEQKSALWQRHLELYVETHPDLTPAQRAIISEAMSLASPALFTKDAAQEARKQTLYGLSYSAARVFTEEQIRALFAELGAPEPSPAGDVSAQGVSCSCSTSSPYCGSYYYCKYGSCSIRYDACGTFWAYDCDGLCVSKQ